MSAARSRKQYSGYSGYNGTGGGGGGGGTSVVYGTFAARPAAGTTIGDVYISGPYASVWRGAAWEVYGTGPEYSQEPIVFPSGWTAGGDPAIVANATLSTTEGPTKLVLTRNVGGFRWAQTAINGAADFDICMHVMVSFQAAAPAAITPCIAVADAAAGHVVLIGPRGTAAGYIQMSKWDVFNVAGGGADVQANVTQPEGGHMRWFRARWVFATQTLTFYITDHQPVTGDKTNWVLWASQTGHLQSPTFVAFGAYNNQTQGNVVAICDHYGNTF